jgi:hypothetical protein
MEMDNEVTGKTGSHYYANKWVYDTRIGRRWNIDPLFTSFESPYSTFNGNPIYFIDPEGDIGSPYGRLRRKAERYGEWYLGLMQNNRYQNYSEASYTIVGNSITFKARLNTEYGTLLFNKTYQISTENFGIKGRFERCLSGVNDSKYRETPFSLFPDPDIVAQEEALADAYMDLIRQIIPLPPDPSEYFNPYAYSMAAVLFLVDINDFTPTGFGKIKSLRGKSQKYVKRNKPRGWSIKPTKNPRTGKRTKGWVMFDEAGNERLRFMRQEKNSKKRNFDCQEIGYFRWQNEKVQYLEMEILFQNQEEVLQKKRLRNLTLELIYLMREIKHYFIIYDRRKRIIY